MASEPRSSLRSPRLEPRDADWGDVRRLVERKYGTWEWNYGESPACNVQRARRFATGEVVVLDPPSDGVQVVGLLTRR